MNLGSKASTYRRHVARLDWPARTDLQKHVTVSSTSMDSVVSIAEYLRTFLLPRPNIGTRTLDRGRRGKHRWTSRWTQGHEIETRDNRERGENKARGSKLREEGGKVIYHTPLHSALLDRDHSAGRWASNGAQTDTLPFSRQRAGEEANRHSDVRQVPPPRDRLSSSLPPPPR